MYGIPDSVKPLSAAEEQVMLAVWACRAPVTRRDIDAKLRAKGWAPATVLNFLYRLEEKGWVKSGKDGNRNTYTPAITQRAYNVWRPCGGGARAGQRKRLRPERAGTGHKGAGGKASGSGRI